MAHGYRQPEAVGQVFLQLPFPQPWTRAIATARIGQNEQPIGIRISGLAVHFPPLGDGVHRKLRGIG